jgi:hypothetical protein
MWRVGVWARGALNSQNWRFLAPPGSKSMGIELIFFGSFMNNIGDYTSDPVRWPKGLGAIRRGRVCH